MNIVPNPEGGAPVLCQHHEPGGRRGIDMLHICKHCSAKITPVFCQECDGRGFDHQYHRCPRCTHGVKRWRAVE